jgi:hypothetical protein
MSNALLLENVIRIIGNRPDEPPVLQVTLSRRLNPAIRHSLETHTKLHALLLPMKGANRMTGHFRQRDHYYALARVICGLCRSTPDPRFSRSYSICCIDWFFRFSGPAFHPGRPGFFSACRPHPAERFFPPRPQDRYNRFSVQEAGEDQEENAVRRGFRIRDGQAFYDK